jgi:hypothetical protein
MAQQNMKDAQGTYSGFITLVKWGTIFAAAVTAFVVLIIS